MTDRDEIIRAINTLTKAGYVVVPLGTEDVAQLYDDCEELAAKLNATEIPREGEVWIDGVKVSSNAITLIHDGWFIETSHLDLASSSPTPEPHLPSREQSRPDTTPAVPPEP